MTVKVSIKNPAGTLLAISSKSQAHRYLICAALSENIAKIKCTTLSEDILATMGALNSMGANITYSDGVFTVVPIKNIPDYASIDVKESGSTLRFLLPIICALGIKSEIKMHGKLPQRPLSPLWEELVKNGAILKKDGNILYTDGKLFGNEYSIAGNISSQFISGLLFALPIISDKGKINIQGKTESLDYIKMTLDALNTFNVCYDCTDSGYVLKENSKYVSSDTLTVEGDWSNSAFWLCLDKICGNVNLEGLNYDSLQGDSRVVEILKQFNGNEFVKIDCADIPDLVVALSAVAGTYNGKTQFYNAARLRLKESDRIDSVSNTLKKFGVEVEITEDGMQIIGKSELNACTVNSYGDHRIVMLSAVLSAKANGEVEIENAEAVNKSYPSFFDDFEKIGGKVEKIL